MSKEWNESDHPRADDGKFTSGAGGSGAKPTEKTKKLSDKIKKKRENAVRVYTPSITERVPDEELYAGDVDADEIRLPKSTDKPDEDISGLPPPEQLKKLYGVEFTGVKGKAALKKLLMERKGHIKAAAHMTLEIDGKPTSVPVDFFWGNNKLGLKHLIADRAAALADLGKSPEEIKRHISELLNNVTEAIEKGTVIGEANHPGDLIVDYRPTRTTLIIGRSYEGEKATYLLTGFKRNKLKGKYKKKPPQ